MDVRKDVLFRRRDNRALGAQFTGVRVGGCSSVRELLRIFSLCVNARSTQARFFRLDRIQVESSEFIINIYLNYVYIMEGSSVYCR